MARAPPTFFSITLSPLFLKSPSSLATSAPRLGLFSPGQAQSVHSPLLKAKPSLGEAGWGQSLEPGREPLTEGRRSPLRPEASIQSLLQQRKLLNRA